MKPRVGLSVAMVLVLLLATCAKPKPTPTATLGAAAPPARATGAPGAPPSSPGTPTPPPAPTVTSEKLVAEALKKGEVSYDNSLLYRAYAALGDAYTHQVIDHAEAYVRGRVHTNGIENFWSLLKRAIRGTYVNVELFHLFRYLDEESFRYNNRQVDDGVRFQKVVGNVTGKRLTYRELIGDTTPA